MKDRNKKFEATEIKDYRNIEGVGVQILSAESWSKLSLGNLMKSIPVKNICQMPDCMNQEKNKQ